MDYVSQFLEFSKNIGKINEITCKLYEKDLNDFRIFLVVKDFDILNVDGNIIKKYIDFISAKYEKNSINRKVSSIKNFYKYLIQNGILNHNPVNDIIVKKEKREKNRILTEEDYNCLLDVCNEEYQDFRTEILIRLLYETELPLDKLLKLKNSDFARYDYENILLVIKGKTKTIRLSNTLRDKLKKFYKTYNIEQFFMDITEYKFKNRLDELRKIAGLEHKILPQMIKNVKKNKSRVFMEENEIEFFEEMKKKYFEIGIGDK